MTGPLAQLYAMIKRQRPIVLDGPPSADIPHFDDPPIGEEHQRPPVQNMEPWWVRRPGIGPRAFRDPAQEGPSPPTGRGELARMYGGK